MANRRPAPPLSPTSSRVKRVRPTGARRVASTTPRHLAVSAQRRRAVNPWILLMDRDVAGPALH
jgi:hypothetical protein